MEYIGKIKVIDIQEYEDGSANVMLDISHNAKELLIEAGLIALLKKHLSTKEEND